jgi:hypothetical protein
MLIRSLVGADRPIIRAATLANVNWIGPRFTFEDLDGSDELSRYYASRSSDATAAPTPCC